MDAGKYSLSSTAGEPVEWCFTLASTHPMCDICRENEDSASLFIHFKSVQYLLSVTMVPHSHRSLEGELVTLVFYDWETYIYELSLVLIKTFLMTEWVKFTSWRRTGEVPCVLSLFNVKYDEIFTSSLKVHGFFACVDNENLRVELKYWAFQARPL